MNAKTEIEKDGYQLYLNTVFPQLWVIYIERLARELIHDPTTLEDMKDLDIYDKIKDVDWASACNAYFDKQQGCLVVQFPRTATITIT